MYKAVKAAIPIAFCAATLVAPASAMATSPQGGPVQATKVSSGLIAPNDRDRRCDRDWDRWKRDRDWSRSSEYRWFWDHCRFDRDRGRR